MPRARVRFLKFMEEAILPISLHMTNTVFIDRAIIVQPFMKGDISDELSGLEFANFQYRGETRVSAGPTRVQHHHGGPDRYDGREPHLLGAASLPTSPCQH
jgi:hypothetical protein